MTRSVATSIPSIFLIIRDIILAVMILIIAVQLENAAHFRGDVQPAGDHYSFGEWGGGSWIWPLRRPRESNDSSVKINAA